MKPFVIGIAGGTGSGKTTVARRLYESLHLDSAVFLDQDSYYKELAHLTAGGAQAVNFDHPDSLDNALLARAPRAAGGRRGDREAHLRLRGPHARAPRACAWSRGR